MVPTQASGDLQVREYAVISLEHLPMWLVKIEPRRVKEQFRAKLIRYQKQCAKVLAAHFLGIGRKESASISPELLERLAGRVEHIQQQLDRLAAAPAAAPALVVRSPTPATPQATVQDRLRHLGWPEANKKQRALIRRQANIWLMLRYGETPDVSGGPGGPCVYYAHQVAVLDEAIGFVRAAVIRREAERERLTGPTLFTDAA